MRQRNPDYISIIVVASGLSMKFGRNRLLEPIGERTMIEYVASECLTSKAKQVVVVVGNDADKVRSALRDYSCEIVFDEDFAKGASYSIKKGLSAVKPDADGVMVVPGDIGLVDRSTINAMIREYSTCYAPIVTTGRHGSSLHPILFDRNLLGELKSMNDEMGGLNNLVSKYRAKSHLVQSSEASLLRLSKEASRIKARLGLSKRS
jgi:molybdenum cofactor cytidylyltransferase